MTTALDLINLTLRRVGALGVGQTAEPEHALDCLKLLNMMLAKWQRERFMIWHMVDVSCQTTGKDTYTVAPSGDLKAERIDHIAYAYIRQTSPMQVDFPLDVIRSREDFSTITLKTFPAFPRCVFYDQTFPIGTLHVWPVPPASSLELHIIVKERLQRFAKLNDAVAMPPEFQEAICLNLALRLYPYLQLKPDARVAKQAKAALEAVKNADAQLPMMSVDPDLLGKIYRAPGGGFVTGGGSGSTGGGTGPIVVPPLNAPANVVLPLISGVSTAGQVLTATYGVWSPTPPVYHVQWYRAGQPISGAIALTYTLTSADVGSSLYVVVTAINSAAPDGVTATSLPTNPVHAAAPPNVPPSVTVAPSITGTPQVGQLLSLNVGSWAGYPAPTFTYQWFTSVGPIPGANSLTYTLTTAEQGYTVYAAVTAMGNGVVTANSNTLGPVTVLQPAAVFQVDANVSGLEVGDDQSNYLIGVSDSLLDYIQAKKFDGVRIPFSWDRAEPAATIGTLNASYMAAVGDTITRAFNRGLKVTIDAHSFGARNVLVNGVRQYIGIGTTDASGTMLLKPQDLADFWGRVCDYLTTNSLMSKVYAIDSMNEPVSVKSAAMVLQTHTLTLSAVRNKGFTGYYIAEGQPYSGAVSFPAYNPNLWQLVALDPIGKTILSGHNYGDYDNSGAATPPFDMSWAYQGGRAVEIPVDPVGNPGEVVDEMTLVRRADHMLQWLKSKGILLSHFGEVGVSTDPTGKHWNAQLRNKITWAKANGAWLALWSMGDAWGENYQLRVNRYSDGLQSEIMAVIDELKGNPVQTFYRVTVPPRIAAGSTTIPVAIKYNGLIPSAITFTPSDNGAGGSFSPASVTTNVTENFSFTFTYTPVANKNGLITVNNDKGWTPPAGKPFSSYVDLFTPIEGDFATLNAADSGSRAVQRVFSIYQRQYKSYTGPLVRLGKLVGGVQIEQDFGRATGVETLDTAAIATWSAGADSGIVRMIKCYDQSLSASLTSNTNITTRQVIEGGWPAVAFADCPLWVNDAGDGKPVARWTGTTYMDFTDSMLNRDNACVVALLKNTGGYNCLNWQFNHKFMVFPGYECSQDGATLSFAETDGTWSHVIAGRTRKSSTGTVGWLNGVSKFTVASLDNQIQVNPDGASGPDYRDQCGFGYYRFTYGSNTWQGDFREAFTFNWTPSDTNKTALWNAANTTYAISGTPVTPSALDPYAPDFRVDFLTRTEYHNGVAQTAGTYTNGTLVTSDATKGMLSTTLYSNNVQLKGAMKTALASDAWTIRIALWTVNPSSGTDLLRRDGTRWIYEKNAQIIGNLSSTDKIPEAVTTGSMPAGNGLPVYIGGDNHDQVLTISRGRNRQVTISVNPSSNGNPGVAQVVATNEAMLTEPTVINLGDASTTYYISRIDVWATDIQDISTLGSIGGETHLRTTTRGANLSTFLNGHNLSGEEDGNSFSSAESTYYNQYNINYYRLPFRMERLFNSWIAYQNGTGPFPTAAGTTVADINTAYASDLDKFISPALASGSGVLLDWHSYAGIFQGNLSGGTVYTLGGTFPDTLFKAAWQAVATRWPRCDYDLQNEPVNAVMANWPATMQQGVNGIRAAGATGYIHLEPTGSYGQLSTFYPGSTIAAAMLSGVTDTLSKLVYHGHQYLDHNGSGQYQDIGAKFEGLTIAERAFAWARQNNVKLFVGEIGVTNSPTQYPDQDREGQWFFKEMYANRDVLLGWAYWTGGVYFKDYYYGTWPVNYGTSTQTDRPQMSYLKLYPGVGYTIPAAPTTKTYYFSAAGADTNDGLSTGTPKQTLAGLAALTLHSGDTVSFRGGDTFTGTGIGVNSDGVTYTSYGTGRATINHSDLGLNAYNVQGITVQNLNFVSTTTSKTNIQFYFDAPNKTFANITVQNCNLSGGNCGVDVGHYVATGNTNNVNINNVIVSSAQVSGIRLYGYASGSTAVWNDHTNVTVDSCLTYNCGYSGIVLGNITGATIQNCVAYNTGGHQSGGVGIWFYNTKNGIIQFCESYNNTTPSSGDPDGDGFDLDGGCVNCTIQYCYSHGNAGAGFFLYNNNWAGSTGWNNNTVRYCVSENDGSSASPYGYGGITMGDGAGGMGVAYVYGNTVYQSLANRACIRINDTANPNGRIANNICVTSGTTARLLDINGTENSLLLFTGNDWYAAGTTIFRRAGVNYATLTALQAADPAFETISGANVGRTFNPQLTSAGAGGTQQPATTIGAWSPNNLTAYKLASGSQAIGAGRNLQSEFGINPGTRNYYGTSLTVPLNIGAY